MPVLGIDGEEAGQQADSVAVVYRAAILIEAAADGAETVAGFERIDDVVIAPIVAARGSDRFSGGGDGRLSEAQAGAARPQRTACAGGFSSHEQGVGIGAVHAHVTGGAVLIARVGHVVAGSKGEDAGVLAAETIGAVVAFQAQA